jgi:hypothetical protein
MGSARRSTEFTVLIEGSIHSRTAVLLRFLLTLPSTTARGRWRERGRMGWNGQAELNRAR